MRSQFLLIGFLVVSKLSAQPLLDSYATSGNYFSFQPLALFESPTAVGIGFGSRLSKRSEIFHSIDYLTPNPLFPEHRAITSGFRSITQYRYHFLRPMRPLIKRRFAKSEKKRRYESFMAVEFRFKKYNLSGTANFINQALQDTLFNHPYQAKANVLGGAILFGAAYGLGDGGRCKIEVTLGIGHKQRTVRFKDIPENYKVSDLNPRMFSLNLYESLGSPYLPFAIRLRYRIG